MTPDQLEIVFEKVLAEKGLFQWWHYVLWLIIAGLGAFLGTYLREKGKNTATKEDIGLI